MILIEYSAETQVSGFLSLICVLISFAMGSIVLVKAIRTKEKILYLFLLTILIAFSPWYSIVLGYILWVFTKEALSYELHIILNVVFIPIGFLAWLDVYMSAINRRKKKIVLISFAKKKIVLISFAIFGVIMELYMFYFLYFASNAPVRPLLGSVHELQPSYAGFLLLYSLIVILIIFITGVHFAIFSMKNTDSKEIRIKGKFLLVAFVSYFIEVVLDVIILNTLILFIILLRIMLIITGVLFYIGFFMPNWIKKLLSLES